MKIATAENQASKITTTIEKKTKGRIKLQKWQGKSEMKNYWTWTKLRRNAIITRYAIGCIKSRGRYTISNFIYIVNFISTDYKNIHFVKQNETELTYLLWRKGDDSNQDLYMNGLTLNRYQQKPFTDFSSFCQPSLTTSKLTPQKGASINWKRKK